MVMVQSERRHATTTDAIPGIRDLWRKTLGDASICIAILDGLVDLSHPCFARSRLTLLEEPTNAQEGRVAARHGTHVASLIFGQHEGPVKGIAPRKAAPIPSGTQDCRHAGLLDSVDA
jgi:hypothetical protein